MSDLYPPELPRKPSATKPITMPGAQAHVEGHEWHHSDYGPEFLADIVHLGKRDDCRCHAPGRMEMVARQAYETWCRAVGGTGWVSWSEMTQTSPNFARGWHAVAKLIDRPDQS